MLTAPFPTVSAHRNSPRVSATEFASFLALRARPPPATTTQMRFGIAPPGGGAPSDFRSFSAEAPTYQAQQQHTAPSQHASSLRRLLLTPFPGRLGSQARGSSQRTPPLHPRVRAPAILVPHPVRTSVGLQSRGCAATAMETSAQSALLRSGTCSLWQCRT